MRYGVKDRLGNEWDIKESNVVRFFYGTIIGRLIVRIFSIPLFSKLMGLFLDSKLSKFKIKSFIKKNNIDMSLYKEKDYKSFNDFFTREIKNIDYSKNKDDFISPCSSKLSVYDINEEGLYRIKNSYYRIKDLVNNDLIYKEFIGGKLLIFRLEATDYHRYIYIDNGSKEKNVFVPGILNTVRPIVLKHFNIYKQNSREYTIMHTDNFDDVIQIEVGAIMVGKINNKHEEYTFKKGEEKGMFEFGGSTIVLMIKKDIVDLDSDIIKNSSDGFETKVSVGESIGKRKKH